MAATGRKNTEALLKPLLDGLEGPERERALEALLGCHFVTGDDEWFHLLLAFKILIPLKPFETAIRSELRSLSRQFHDEIRKELKAQSATLDALRTELVSKGLPGKYEEKAADQAWGLDGAIRAELRNLMERIHDEIRAVTEVRRGAVDQARAELNSTADFLKALHETVARRIGWLGWSTLLVGIGGGFVTGFVTATLFWLN